MARQAAKTLDQVEQSLEPQTDKRKETKEFVVKRSADGLYTISYTAGGEVPDELKGRWTGMQRAEAAIANYKIMKKQAAA